MNSRIEKLLTFLNETIDYFVHKIEGVDRDRYFADRDIRNILDKTINDIILCIVDVSEEILKRNKRNIPKHIRIQSLPAMNFLGDIVLKVAPLTKHRNDTIHQYLKINWQNIFTVKSKISDIKEFEDKVKKLISR